MIAKEHQCWTGVHRGARSFYRPGTTRRGSSPSAPVWLAYRYRGHELVVPHSVNECPPGIPGQGADAVAEPRRRRLLLVGGHVLRPARRRARFRDCAPRFRGLPGVGHCRGRRSWVLLRTLIPARYSYPWTLVATARYSLDADTGLDVELSATNIGSGTAPSGWVSTPTSRRAERAPTRWN